MQAMFKRKILYIEDNHMSYNMVLLLCKKIKVELHWLPNVPSLEIAPKKLIESVDFILIDCRGTTLNEDDCLARDFYMEGVEVFATSSSPDLKFDKIGFVDKANTYEFLGGYYNE